MFLVWRRPPTPIAVRRPPPSSASLPSRRFTPSALASLFSRGTFEVEPPPPSTSHHTQFIRSLSWEERAEPATHPNWVRTGLGRVLPESYQKSELWSVHLLNHLELTVPLQPVLALTPRARILQVWEAHIGSFETTSPPLLRGQPWLLPRAAREWWGEDYAAQLELSFPRKDIIFLLNPAEDIIATLKGGERELVTLKENLYWLTSEPAPSACSSLGTSASSNISPPSPIKANRYTLSILQGHSPKITRLRCTFSSVHRLPPLLAVIAALLGYHRARARRESAAIALREREGRSTSSDALVLQAIDELAHWHVAPEMQLEELTLAAEEWFARGQRAIRDIARLEGLIEGRLHAL